MSHITGGGYYENLSRMLDSTSYGIDLDLSDVKIPPIFSLLMDKGGISIDEMYHVFNMGIGFVVTVARDECDTALQLIQTLYPDACVIGTVSQQKGLRIK